MLDDASVPVLWGNDEELHGICHTQTDQKDWAAHPKPDREEWGAVHHPRLGWAVIVRHDVKEMRHQLTGWVELRNGQGNGTNAARGHGADLDML